MDTRPRLHQLIIEVEFDERTGLSAARDKVGRWLGTFGHTASGHGFEFKTVACLSPINTDDK